MIRPFPGISVTFDLDLEGSLDLDATEAELLEALRTAALAGAQYVKAAWVATAGALGAHDTGAYIRGIAEDGRIEVLSESGDADTLEIVIGVTNTAQHASIVEDGHAAFHLPSAINWSSGRVKRAKDGTPYLQVPFRHAAFQTATQREASGMTHQALRRMMPQEVHAEAKKLTATRPLRQGPFRAADGSWVAADRYRWGGRLDRSHVRPGITLGSGIGPDNSSVEERRTARQVGRNRRGPLVNPEWQSSKFHGLFKAGTAGHTSYMTIRTVKPNSPGWNIPAQTGFGVARQVAAALNSDEAFAAIVRDALAGRLVFR